jgi:DNA-binding response OmpR family regulator
MTRPLSFPRSVSRVNRPFTLTALGWTHPQAILPDGGTTLPRPPEALLPDSFAEACLVPVAPTARLPLQGLTLLAVEDSRFASDALRLLSQRSGARLRRAESLEAAWAHLRVYRPDVIVVDLGLPDGRGETLIRRLAQGSPPGAARPVLLAISGDPAGRGAALAAGADGFLEKPVAGLRAFQAAILAHLTDHPALPPGEEEVSADPLALHDDLAQAARALDAPDAAARRYLAGFLGGLARQTQDEALSAASAALTEPGFRLDALSRLLQDRLATGNPFRPEAGQAR